MQQTKQALLSTATVALLMMAVQVAEAQTPQGEEPLVTVNSGAIVVEPPWTVSRDAVFVGSATLAGLAVFGSTIILRFKPKTGHSAKRYALMSASLIVTFFFVMAQGQLMLMACCDPIFVPAMIGLWVRYSIGSLLAITGLIIIAAHFMGMEDSARRPRK